MSTPRPVPSSEITPEALYFNRRNLLRAAAIAGSTLATGTLYRTLNRPGSEEIQTASLPELVAVKEDAPAVDNGFVTDETPTPYRSITNYNNFYEFTTNKDGVAFASRRFVSRPWTVTVDGLVHKPGTLDLDEILKISIPEERIYRMRCVEGWSMVIPWAGYSLSKLLNLVDPMGEAKFVAFETLHDPARMPGQNLPVLDWPYVEGLRLDEALHPLTILATGLYGRELPTPNGAPLRLVVPWKYGFKSIKSIVRITLMSQQPRTSWNMAAPGEYGFYSNVNPAVDHPRWSQATEQRLGELGRRETLLFNGYAEQVAHLYQGLDLSQNF